MRSSSVPNIHSASMLKRMCPILVRVVQEHVRDRLPHAKRLEDRSRHQSQKFLDAPAARPAGIRHMSEKYRDVGDDENLDRRGERARSE